MTMFGIGGFRRKNRGRTYRHSPRPFSQNVVRSLSLHCSVRARRLLKFCLSGRLFLVPERGKENPDDLKIFFRPRAAVLSSAANPGEGPKVSSNIFLQVPVPKVIFELPSV
jgi:hypothetical protein